MSDHGNIDPAWAPPGPLAQPVIPTAPQRPSPRSIVVPPPPPPPPPPSPHAVAPPVGPIGWQTWSTIQKAWVFGGGSFVLLVAFAAAVGGGADSENVADVAETTTIEVTTTATVEEVPEPTTTTTAPTTTEAPVTVPPVVLWFIANEASLTRWSEWAGTFSAPANPTPAGLVAYCVDRNDEFQSQFGPYSSDPMRDIFKDSPDPAIRQGGLSVSALELGLAQCQAGDFEGATASFQLAILGTDVLTERFGELADLAG